jgi:hypothetical protein
MRPMHKPLSAIESTRPHTFFILPELLPSRFEALAILILADGNTRSSPSGGYAGGARRVVSVAEHLARRPDVAVMVACILSPDNVAKRGDGFFSALYEEFIQLGADVDDHGALVGAGIRMEVHGDLGALRARGGRAVALADAIEAVVAMTAHLESPALRLILGVGYGRDIARELDVDIILRTGMEEPGVLRLSGIESGERIASCAITTLWPQVELREVDDVIDLCKRRAAPRLAGGHDAAAIVELALALSEADAGAPVKATITTDATPAALSAALDHLFSGPLRHCATIAVEQAGDEAAATRRWGRRETARQELRIVRGSPRGEGEVCSVLAPGQRGPLFTLPDWLALGQANVYACGTCARDLVEAICAAQRFSAAYPPLLGGERKAVPAAPRAPAVVPERAGARERDEIGDRFADKALAWAASAGLMLPGAAWRTAAVNYALTAFFIHYRVPTEWDDAGAGWEPRADLTARYMLLVAAGDEGIFDRVLAGETPERRWARLEASSRFFQGVLGSDRSPARPPRVPGAELLAAIADQWRELFERHRGTCAPAVAASFRAGLASLYAASLAEHRPGLGSDRLTEGAALAAVVEERFAAAPPCVAARARALVRSMAQGPSAANELRTLLHLAEVSSSIGAGLLFRTAALAAPSSSVPDGSIAVLDAAAKLLDYQVRLSNDASGFLGSPGGDRDAKENACTILVPSSASGAAREAAIMRALATRLRLASWLGGQVGGQVDRVAAAWPSMGALFRRGALVGRRVYEVAHYTTVTRAQMSAIFDEAEAALR